STKYYYLNGMRVAQARKVGDADWPFTWNHADHLRSATRLTDSDGAEVRRLAYAAFGEEAENSGPGDAPTYTYTGKEQDASGLMYYGARYYDPALARFITADTVYDVGPQGLNRYSYALNNPIKYNDPDGRYTRGDETNDLSTFMRIFRQWEPVAARHRNTWRSIPTETKNYAKIRVFDTDFRAEKQIVNEVGGNKQFSYNKSFGKYLDVGLPLDVAHFFKMVRLAEDYPNFIVRSEYVKEEFKQTKAKDPNARTSAFAPEDLFSNELGVIFADSLGLGDDMANELEAFLKEVDTLFTTDSLSDGKYLTKRRIARLRKIAKKYYGTDDLSFFAKESDIYLLEKIKKINDNAEKRDYPFYKEKTSSEKEEPAVRGEQENE
ncbi:MAG: RHS repeat-associated core domain-containing protein, partial [Deltaproteobacteria bacterium]|nr:RHS repeat-associated core domain-containing protein [Deltaproteobacteria bacterium]